MTPGTGRTKLADVSGHTLVAALGGIVAVVTYPLAALLVAIWQRPALYFGFASAMTVTVLGKQTGELLSLFPPVVPVTASFLLLSVARGGLRRVLAAWRASPAVFWVYLLVCFAEVLVALYRGALTGWAYVGGRAAFLVVLLATVAVCADDKGVSAVLRGMIYGVAFIGLLTIVRAFDLAPPLLRGVLGAIGANKAPARTFGPLTMPFPRTLGLAMPPDKFGIMAAVAIAGLVLSRAGEHAQVRSTAGRALVLLLSLSGVVISQTRGVYLTILLNLGLTLCFLCFPIALGRRVSSVRASWMVALVYALFLILANVAFPYVAPEELIDVGSAQSMRNVTSRIEANSLAWQMFKQAPILGIGHGQFESLAFTTASIHNHFGEQIVSTGLVGGLPYLLFHLWVLAQALQLLGHVPNSVQPLARTLVVSVLSIYFAFQFFPGFFVSTFAVVVGMVVSLCVQHTGSRPAPLLVVG